MLVVLHSAHPVTWSAWHVAPSIVVGAVIVAGLYAYAWRVAAEVPSWRPAAFVSGSLLVFVALTSPLDAAAHHLLSMHMLQHVVLTTFGPPLILLGLPPTTLERLVPERGRLTWLLRGLTAPFVAGALFLLNMWLWHVPPVYEQALRHLGVHIAMHIAFIGTGLVFWWPILAPLPRLSWTGPGGRLLYVFVTGFPMGVLALLLLASDTILYDFYRDQPSRLWGVSPLEDQQVAGVIMGSLGEAASFLAFSLIFVRYILTDQDPDQDQDEAPAAPAAAAVPAARVDSAP